jgi:triphosphoribosyl-dephospho-CoA synthetase
MTGDAKRILLARLERLHRLHAELMALWASPGGSADLLVVTLFLDRLEGGSPGI